MKILHLSTHDAQGGAAKAAYRIHQSQRKIGLDSTLMVITKQNNDPSVILPNSLNHRAKLELYRTIKENQAIYAKQMHKDGFLISTGRVGIDLVKEINDSPYDLINLHWIINMLSIKDIGKIIKPIVWTFHDMWPLNGIFHYFETEYKINANNNGDTSIVDYTELDHLIFSEKKKYWNNQSFTVITPSYWLSNCTKESVLFKKSSIYTIPNPILLSSFYRRDKITSRQELRLPLNQKLILFCATNILKNTIKGWKTVHETMQHLEVSEYGKYSLIICGNEEKKYPLPFRAYWLGKINEDEILAKLYSAVDVVICPSRQEAFGQVALEAQACGTPVVASDVGGYKDIIKHNKTGLLVNKNDSNAFAAGICKILSPYVDIKKISKNSIDNAFSLSEMNMIANKYYDIYKKINSAK